MGTGTARGIAGSRRQGSSVIVSSFGTPLLSLPPGRSTEVKVPPRAGVGLGAAHDRA